MANIPPVTDDYIDSIIKSAGVANPNLNKTQGTGMRDLIKKLRDSFMTALSGKQDALTFDSQPTSGSNNNVKSGGIYDWVLSLGGGVIPDATESEAGIVALATVAQALARTDDTKAMTALKTISLILDEKKKVSYQINPVGLNEVSIYMENAGQVNSVLVTGATNVKLKTGLAGNYPTGEQAYPFSYAAGDRVFITYNYSDLNNASCNVKLKCQDN